MKRGLFLILAFYLFSISGIAAQFHYCNGELETIELGFGSSDDCCCDGKTTCKSCCKNEQIGVDLSAHFANKVATQKPFDFSPAQTLHFSEPFSIPTFSFANDLRQPAFKDNRAPVFIRLCTFRL
jgi:hypothetical protein